jgi:hypothetical protein
MVGRIDQRTRRLLPPASIKRNALRLLYAWSAQLAVQAAVWAHCANGADCGWVAKKRLMAAGSGFPVAGSTSWANVNW